MDIYDSNAFSSLRVKFPLAIFCVIVTIALLSTYFILQTFNTSIRDIKKDYVNNAVESIGVNISIQLRQTYRDLRMTSSLPDVLNALKDTPEPHKIAEFQEKNIVLKELFENVKNVYGYYDSLFLTDSEGEYLIGARETRLTTGVDGDRKLIQKGITKRELTHAPIIRNTVTNDLLLPIILPTTQIQANSVGALVASVRMDEVIRTAIREASYDVIRCFGLIIDHTGMTLVNEENRKYLPPNITQYYAEMFSTTTGTFSTTEKGKEFISAYYNIPNTNIYIIGVIGEDFKDIQLNAIRDTMTLTSVGMSMFMLIAVSLFTFPLTHKIAVISNFAQKVAQGTSETTIDVHSNDEIGILARSLESTVQTLREMVTRSESATKAKSDFLARMSHEIRTPMNGIIGMTYLAMRANPDAKQTEYLERIDNAAKSLLSIINDILDFSKIEAEKMDINPTSFRVEPMLSSIRDILLPKCAEKNISFTYTIAENMPEIIRTDPVRLTQICTNLCSNAVKFTTHGTVHLSVALQSEDNESLVLIFSVQDTGIGMSSEEQKHIFESFTQADGTTTRKYGGTGLGLAICKSLIELLGGSIHVKSEVNKGSTFTFTIVAEKGNASEVEEHSIPKSENLSIIPLDILLVEDNEINQAIALEVLQDMGATVTLAQNGEEAIEKWENGVFDVILMDIQMPIMDGLTAATHIRASSRPRSTTVPILAMTAHAMSSDRDKSLEHGMNDHITKPININELRNALVYWGTASKLGA